MARKPTDKQLFKMKNEWLGQFYEEVSKFINAYKSASSRLLKKEFPQIRQKLWKECFWSQSFCLLTTGGAPIEVIRKYIESQGEKSRKRGRSYGKQSI